MSDHVIPFGGCFRSGSSSAAHPNLVFVGLPDDSQSSFKRGSAAAPKRIREAYDGRCYNSAAESGADLAGAVTDFGDLPQGGAWAETAELYKKTAEALYSTGRIPFFAGGDHAVTVPVVEALGVLGKPVHVVQFDAHPDLYPEFDGNRNSHACAAARILEMPHVAALTQIGVRTMNARQRDEAAKWGDRLRVVSAGAAGSPAAWPKLTGETVYVTIDLDAFDPAFAPGVAHPVPGGLSPRQALDFIQGGEFVLAGMDVVEVNPGLDLADRTAILAARLLHEGMGRSGGGH